jgi:hypothetical protein
MDVAKTVGPAAEKEMGEMETEAGSGSMIENLAKMTDQQLLEITGWNMKLDAMKADIAEMAKLTGKAREEAEKEVTRMMTPNVDSHSIHWALEDAKRAAKRSGKEEAADCCCTSVLD